MTDYISREAAKKRYAVFQRTILSDRYKEGFHDGLKRALQILANDVKDVGED